MSDTPLTDYHLSVNGKYGRIDVESVRKLERALIKIRDLDYRGNRHESHFIADKALKPL